MKNIIIILMAFMLVACIGKTRKMTLEGDVNDDVVFVPKGLVMPETVGSGELSPSNGIRYKGTRSVDPANPPVKLELAAAPADKMLDLADFYTGVEYVKLKHPLSADGVGFMDDKELRLISNGRSSVSASFSSGGYAAGNYLIAGDKYGGYHCYDLSGKYIYSLAIPGRLPEKDETNPNRFRVYEAPFKTLQEINVNGDLCMLTIFGEGTSQNMSLEFHDIPSRKAFTRPYTYTGFVPIPYNSETFFSLYTNPLRTGQPFSFSFGIKSGDTLSRFVSHNPVPTSQGSGYSSPDLGSRTYYGGTLYLRQVYNDTVYRVTSPERLVPAYTLDLGVNRINVATDLYGDKEGKLIPGLWLETGKFVYASHTENENTETTRKDGSVKFFHSYYDKTGKKLYRIPAFGTPQDLLLKSGNDNIIPVPAAAARCGDNSLSVFYTKSRLKGIIDGEGFSSLSKVQQDRVNSLYGDLADDELLVMVLK